MVSFAPTSLITLFSRTQSCCGLFQPPPQARVFRTLRSRWCFYPACVARAGIPEATSRLIVPADSLLLNSDRLFGFFFPPPVARCSTPVFLHSLGLRPFEPLPTTRIEKVVGFDVTNSAGDCLRTRSPPMGGIFLRLPPCFFC